jgi:hypothetical protein
MQRSSERFREDSGSRKGRRERIRDFVGSRTRMQGRRERVNSAKEKGAAIITD